METRRPLSLRAMLLILVAVLGIIAAAAAVALVLVTAALHGAADRMGAEIEKVRLSEELEIALLTRTPPLAGVRPKESLHHRIDQLRPYLLTAPEGKRALEDAERAIGRDLAASAPAAAGGAAPSPALMAAVAAVDRISKLGVAQSHASLARVKGWSRIADAIAWILGTVLIAAVAVSLAWVLAVAFAPAQQIEGAMRRFAAGESSSRAAERGSAELRSVAREFNDMAGELVRRRSDEMAVLGAIAHDMRNPLAAMKAALAAVAPERALPEEPRLRHLLELVRRQMDRLIRMTDDLVDGSRLAAGTLEMKLAREDLGVIAGEVLDLYRAAAPGRELRLSLPAGPVVVRCDGTRIGQLLGNLVSNAIKYSPPETPVRVEVLREGDGAAVRVSDVGPGIPPEERSRVFEPFRRGRSADRIPGAGLGLFIAQRIAAAHGGSLEIASDAGAGARFVLRLPVGAGAPRPQEGPVGGPAETPA